MKSLFLLLIVATCSTVHADNWSHWRGPTANGTSLTAQPPTEWSPEKNIKWKVEVPGRGSGSPIVWDNKVFVVTAVSENPEPAPSATRPRNSGRRFRGNRGGFRGRGATPLSKLQFRIFCFDRNSGEKIWDQLAIETKPHEGTHSTNGFASASPCTDGQHIYAHFGSRGLFCYSMDGQLKWSRTDFPKMQCRAGFGEGSSPVLAGDKIIIPWDHEGQSSIFALNKLTGETIWQTPRDEPTCWATPLIVPTENGHQVVMNGQTSARSYDLATGKELWRCSGQTERPVATPVFKGDRVFVGSGHRGSFLAAFKLTGQGNIQGTDNVDWSVNRDTPDIASPVLSGNRLYFHKGKSGIITCLNADTGQPIFTPQRVPGVQSTYASPIAAGGFVFLTGRSGTTAVIKDADSFEIVSTNSVGEGVDATPAAVDNQLFIRGERHLFCIQADQ